jgi:hypothetical protein
MVKQNGVAVAELSEDGSHHSPSQSQLALVFFKKKVGQ